MVKGYVRIEFVGGPADGDMLTYPRCFAAVGCQLIAHYPQGDCVYTLKKGSKKATYVGMKKNLIYDPEGRVDD